MTNKYCNLDGSKKIKDEYQKINIGFDKVEEDVNKINDNINALDERVDTIITTPIDGEAAAQELVDARGGRSTLGQRLDEYDAYFAHLDDIVINVKQFGAKGDGVTDDTQAIQSAIEYCKAGIIYIPSGTYLVDKLTVSNSNLVIKGDGDSSKIVTYSNYNGTIGIEVLSDNVWIDSITVEKLNPNYDNYIGSVGIIFGDSNNKVTNSIVTNCTIIGFNYSLDFFKGKDENTLFIFKNNKLYGAKPLGSMGSGITTPGLYNNGNNIGYIINNIILPLNDDYPIEHGIYIHEGNILIQGNTIGNTEHHGIKSGYISSSSEEAFIEKLIIRDNIIYDIGYVGIHLDAIKRYFTLIEGNTIHDCKASFDNPESGNGINLWNETNQYIDNIMIVRNNHIYNVARKGIDIVGNSKLITIESNLISDFSYLYNKTFSGIRVGSIADISNLTIRDNCILSKETGNKSIIIVGNVESCNIVNNFSDDSVPILSLIKTNTNGNSWQPIINYSTSIPTEGNYIKGDIIYNTNPRAGGYVGWVCVESGAPGTWKGFGLIES